MPASKGEPAGIAASFKEVHRGGASAGYPYLHPPVKPSFPYLSLSVAPLRRLTPE